MAKRFVYLDHAAATPVDPAVLRIMQPFFSKEFGNPSAIYESGQTAARAIAESRKSVADILGAQSENIIFTSGGTESVALAILGLVRANTARGRHIITTPVEHPAVLESLQELRREGYSITFVPVDETGVVDPETVIDAIKPDTVLISIMMANNEVGTIEPIAEIGRKIMKYRQDQGNTFPLFHTDACQAPNYLELKVEKLHVDALSLNGSKMYGPKGSGCLYVRRGLKLAPLWRGGGQEAGLRSGTENVPAIIGFGKALERASALRAKEVVRLQKLTSYFWDELKKSIPSVLLNGPELGESRLPNNLNVLFPRVEADQFLLYLDRAGVSCSAASACASQRGETSHVLKAVGLSDLSARQTIRFTLGRSTTTADLDYAVAAIASTYQKIVHF